MPDPDDLPINGRPRPISPGQYTLGRRTERGKAMFEEINDISTTVGPIMHRTKEICIEIYRSTMMKVI
jgi:hypothetical protein